jgi:hypothetical protein
LESVDISNAYINGVLKDVEVYMKELEGFAVNDSSWCKTSTTQRPVKQLEHTAV